MKISRGMENEFSSQNSKIKNICARCMRSDIAIQNQLNSGLFDHYKNLCKSLKCFVHKQSNAQLIQKGCLTDEKKSVVKLKNSEVFKGPKFIHLSELKSYSLCKVEDFEDNDNGTEEIIDYDLYLQIESTVMNLDVINEIKLQDVVGDGFLKEIIDRTIIWPMKKPDVFKGLRSAPKGVLLFGPPGTGKTLIGQSIAFQTDWTFFNISSSSLVSKWMGESEKLVRTMFAVAKARQPSLIFIDEVDSLLSYRNPDEDASSRRMKNEFLENMDGCSSEEQDKIMIIGATNRPHELDEAARQRFIKRLYIPLPDETSRKELLAKLLENECHSLEEDDICEIVRKTEGYSLADIKSLSQEAAMGPIKSLSADAIIHLKADRIRPITLEDFMVALQLIKPSVTNEELEIYEIWNSKYGYSNQNYARNRTLRCLQKQRQWLCTLIIHTFYETKLLTDHTVYNISQELAFEFCASVFLGIKPKRHSAIQNHLKFFICIQNDVKYLHNSLLKHVEEKGTEIGFFRPQT